MRSWDLSPQEKAQRQDEIAQAKSIINQYQSAHDLWGEGGMGRAVLHAGVGGFATSDLGGTLGAGSTSLAAPVIHDISNNLDGALKYTFDTGAGMAIGGLVGGQGGMMTGANTDWHNRQLHIAELERIHQTADEYAKENGISKTQALKELAFSAAMLVDKTNRELLSGELTNEQQERAEQWLASHGQGNAILNSDGNVSAQTYFSATEAQWENSFTNISYIGNDATFNFLDMVGSNNAANILNSAAMDSSGRYGGGRTSANNVIANYGNDLADLQQLGQDAKALIPLINKEIERNIAALGELRQSNPNISDEALQNSEPYKQLQRLQSSIKYAGNVMNDHDYVTPLYKDDPEFQRSKDMVDLTILHAAWGLSTVRGGYAVKAGNLGKNIYPTGKPDGDGMIAQIGNYSMRGDGSVVGPRGGASLTAGFTKEGKVAYRSQSGGYFTMENGKRVNIQAGEVQKTNPHGNTLGDQPAELYCLLCSRTGGVRKYGETTHGEDAYGVGNQKRYTSKELKEMGVEYQRLESGTKRDMHSLQAEKIKQYEQEHGHKPDLNKTYQ